MKWARSLAAILAGYAALYIIIRIFPGSSPAYFVIGTIIGATAGGFISAWLAGGHEIAHAAGIGFLIIAAAFLDMRARGINQPGWSEIALAGCGPVAAMFGAALRMFSRSRLPK